MMPRPERARRALAAALVASSVAVAAAGCGARPSSPDVVLITIDTLRADRLGCYGGSGGLTPTLDALAASGVRFADASAAVPVTLPSHASLMTGRYPTAHGVRDNGTFVVPQDEVTLAERFRDGGWRTAAVVAAYPLDERYGLGQGFDRYDDDFPKPDASGRLQVHFSERPASVVTDRAIASWRTLGDGPRFLWVHYFDPHAPYAPPEPWLERHGERRYDGEVAYVDAEIGRLLEAIRAEGRDPVVIATADHGEGLGDHDEKTHGVFVYQSTMHVPLIVSGPGRWGSGSVVEAPVSLVDVAPTILALAGLAPLEGIDGRDLAPGLAGGGEPERPVYGESFVPRFAFRFSELRMIRSGPLKYVEAPVPELYDLAQDPGENRNLSGGHPEEADLAADLAALAEGEDPDAARRAAGSLDAEAAARLRSLGYVAGGPSDGAPDGERGRDPKTMTAYIRRHDEALGLLSQGEVDAGIAAFRELRGQAPENWLVPFQMAGGLIVAGRLREAEATLMEVVAEAPEFANAYLMLAEVQAMLGEYAESTRNYDAAAALQPWAGEPAFQKGRMLADAGRSAEAVEAYLEAIRREPSGAEAVDALVRLRRSRGEVASAAADLRAVVAAVPDAVEPRVGLALALRLSDDLEGAAAAAAEALALAPTAVRPNLEAGEVALELGAIDEAGQRFEAALAADPDSLQAHFGIARALALRGETVEADARFAAILREEPRYAPVLSFRGLLRERAGEARAAAELYRRALQIDPNDREAWRGMERLRASHDR